MKNKKIVVLLKYYKGELNPFDGCALECALSSGATDITAVTMSPIAVKDTFKSLTRLGVKCVMISDPVYAGSDTIATSYILSSVIKRLNPDVIFCGRQSVDGDTAQVPPILAERLGFDIKTKAISFDKNVVTLRCGEVFTPQDKTIITFEKFLPLRFPSIFSKTTDIEVLDNSVLKLDKNRCGLIGSPTRVIASYESSVGRRTCSYIDKNQLFDVIKNSLDRQRVLKTPTIGEKLDVIYYVGNVKNIADGIAKTSIQIDVDGKSPRQVADELLSKNAKTVIFEDSDYLKVLSSRVAVLCNAGICADCISFRVQDGRFIMTRPALGGNVTADIICNSDMAFATVRTVKKGDADVIFSVGKGAIDYIDKIKDLATIFNAEVCCSRIVADSGKLPYDKQVGLTGRTVCPKVYVAFGISGAVQHTSAIAGAGTVIAVNVDKDARIFDYADYGIVRDLKIVLDN